MPVILGNKVSTEAWLDGSPSSKFDPLLQPYEEPDLAWYPVTSAMGKPSFDGPECIKEIQLKTEEMKPISMFFVKKGTKSNDPISQDINNCKELSKSDQPKSLKEEPETEKRMDHQPPTRKIDDDLKPNVTTSITEGATSFHVKRDYNELSADTKPSVDEVNTLRMSPVKKKGNLGSAGDKQPTLFSYFAKG